ncbi:uncharacterized protein LOC133744346 [Rosa rugosa]|uniref:uncharacterized protein LOC133744346 n=1 Tax=Rosa rugosa TaxID=74645 RepID=UPI002B413C3A|nr:uncharacterized protein LOC133744346 [Rosa rugosa]
MCLILEERVASVDHSEDDDNEEEDEKKENGGVNPDRCKMFELTHVHDNEKPDEPNSKAIALMKDKIDKMKTTKRASQLPEVLNDFEINEVYVAVLGKETRGGV